MIDRTTTEWAVWRYAKEQGATDEQATAYVEYKKSPAAQGGEVDTFLAGWAAAETVTRVTDRPVKP